MGQHPWWSIGWFLFSRRACPPLSGHRKINGGQASRLNGDDKRPALRRKPLFRGMTFNIPDRHAQLPLIVDEHVPTTLRPWCGRYSFGVGEVSQRMQPRAIHLLRRPTFEMLHDLLDGFNVSSYHRRDMIVTNRAGVDLDSSFGARLPDARGNQSALSFIKSYRGIFQCLLCSLAKSVIVIEGRHRPARIGCRRCTAEFV